MRTRGWIGLLGVALAVGCGEERKPYLGAARATGHDGTDSGLLHLPPPTPPSPDAGGLCANDIVPVVVDRPNFYFVVDASGSMGDPMPAGTTQPGASYGDRYSAAREAIRTLLESVGHRVSYGASVFPGQPGAGCSGPQEVFSLRPGDPVSYARSGADGLVLQELLRQLLVTPSGLTPTALALTQVKDTLAGLPGTTYAFLLTDGAPNCNSVDPCDIAHCTPNIENDCPIDGNCCDPGNGVADWDWCLDAAPTIAAVADLRAAGVRTYIIGMPGTGAYVDLMNQMAIAGGVPQDGDVKYYPTASADELSKRLSQIGLAIALSCDIPLKEAPPNPKLVNVFFDQSLLTFGDPDGWEWADATTVRVVGKACDDLKSGQASQVQVVAGCPSVTR
ncbi:MAG TPA: vWA domain-containing protein [Polyangiaceae bacterium]|nr:vWA domain-containing protein [Polyangiaceae bacterium]